MSRNEYKHKLLFLVNKRDYFHHQYYIYSCLLKLLSERISHDHLHIFGMNKIFIGMLTTSISHATGKHELPEAMPLVSE
jgi:hypothetical protein